MIGGEDLADRNYVSPVVGVGSPNVILLIIAMYLMLHTIREQAPLRFNFNFIRKFMKKNGRNTDNH